ncbi:MAG: domain S-box [Verrucomicrobiales bacterium]|nr:domain S-box [Verrucomicrobiales bacterium]
MPLRAECLFLFEQWAGRMGYPGACIMNCNDANNGHGNHPISDRFGSSEPYRQIVEMAGEGIWAIDSQMRTTYVNPRMADLLGYAPQEMIGRDPSEFVDAHERHITIYKWRNGCHNHHSEHDFRFRSKGGTEVWTACSVTPFHDASGKFIGAFAILTEETQRRHEAQELKKSEHQAQSDLSDLELIYQQVPAGLAFLDQNLRFVKINDRLAKLNACAVHDHMGRTLREVLPNQADAFEHLLLYAMETGDPLENLEFHSDMPDQPGIMRDWLASFYPVHTSKIHGINVVVMEITDRKRAEAALRQSQERYAAFVKNSTEAIWRFELEQPIAVDLPEEQQVEWFYRHAYLAECNDTMARMYGFRNHEAMHGLRLEEILPRSNTQNVQFLQAFIRSGYRLSDQEALNADQNGRPFYISSTAFAEIENGLGHRVWGTTRDITSRKKAEEGLQRYAETLEQRVAERTAKLEQTVQSLEGVCYHVAHDLRAPLRAMEGFTSILLQQYATQLDEQGQEFARRISQAAGRMDHLIRDLLDYGRLSHTKLTFCQLQLETQLAQVLGSIDEEIQRKGAVVDVREPLGTIWGNATVLDQILTNLITNGIKYVQPGTSPRITIWSEQREGLLRLWVQDNGIGIAPEHHDRIFRVFERLHRNDQYPGTGIGLAIVAKGAQIMGGRAGLESTEGTGSRFWIELRTKAPATENR